MKNIICMIAIFAWLLAPLQASLVDISVDSKVAIVKVLLKSNADPGYLLYTLSDYSYDKNSVDLEPCYNLVSVDTCYGVIVPVVSASASVVREYQPPQVVD